MATIKPVMCIFAVLFSVLSVVLLAEGQTTTSNSTGMFGLPNFGMPSFGSGFPGGPSIPGLPQFFGSRQRRQANETDAPAEQDGPPTPAHNPEHEHQDRFFFSLFSTTVTGCNFTATPGISCLNCYQTLNCLSSNAGLSRTCHGIFPYCNNGRCSFTPGSACNGTSG